MIPSFDGTGNLPAGIHEAEWAEVEQRFGVSEVRQRLIRGLRLAIADLRDAGCRWVYLDGSFVTAKPEPGDFDACWDINDVNPESLHPALLTFDNERAMQKARYGGELFPGQLPEGESGRTFLEFFQTDKTTGRRKGILRLNLESLP